MLRWMSNEIHLPVVLWEARLSRTRFSEGISPYNRFLPQVRGKSLRDEMICGKAQGFIIRIQEAKTARKRADLRKSLRRHSETCRYCLKKRKHGNKGIHKSTGNRRNKKGH